MRSPSATAVAIFFASRRTNASGPRALTRSPKLKGRTLRLRRCDRRGRRAIGDSCLVTREGLARSVTRNRWRTSSGDMDGPNAFFASQPLWLCDPCNLAIMRAAHPDADPSHFKPGKSNASSIYDFVERASDAVTAHRSNG
jgi:hypothetical protein